jgi:uncharacterized protein
MEWLAGLTIGLLSSFHCVGMCGPLAFALPVHNMNSSKRNTSLLLYHAGRIMTYMIIGVLFGIAGRQLQLAGIQRWVSLTTGIIILLVFIQQQYFTHQKIPFFLRSFYDKVLEGMNYFLKRKSVLSFAGLGLVNGLLPCGMVYLAVAGALNTSTWLQGMWFMGAFGLGTLPLMLGTHAMGIWMNVKTRADIRKLVPYVAAFIGVLLILRGLNLGIPYVSPIISNTPVNGVECH